MTAGDTRPTEPLPQWAVTPAGGGAPERKRRRVWPWIVALVVLIGLLVAGWFIGEAIARDVVTQTIREQVIAELGLPADQAVGVVVEGAVLPQLIGGELNDITITSDDVALGEQGAFVGDVTVHAQGIPIRGDGAAESASATVALDEEQLRTLLATVDAIPAETIALAAPDVTAETSLQFFGISFPIGIALTPTAVDGDIVLTPSSLQLAGTTISASDLQERFGSVADLVVRDYTVCIAQYVPAGVELTGIAVEGDEVIADLDIDGAIISDAALQEMGTCAPAG